jgi:HD-like signal output (HDOD) protein
MKELFEPGTSDQTLMDLQHVASRARDLPPMPVTALRALEMTRDPNMSARSLQEVIAKDQALTARMLRIVKSAQCNSDALYSNVQRGCLCLRYC